MVSWRIRRKVDWFFRSGFWVLMMKMGPETETDFACHRYIWRISVYVCFA